MAFGQGKVKSATTKKLIKQRDPSEMTPIQAAVVGDLMIGATWNSIEEKFGVPRATANMWLKQFGFEKPPPMIGKNIPLPQSGDVMLHPQLKKLLPVRVQKAASVDYPSYDNIDPLTGQVKDIRIQLVDYVQNSLLALNSQLLIGADPTWLGKQNASDLAAYHRVIGDRFERLLAAFAAGQQPEEDYTDDDDGDEVVKVDAPDVPG